MEREIHANRSSPCHKSLVTLLDRTVVDSVPCNCSVVQLELHGGRDISCFQTLRICPFRLTAFFQADIREQLVYVFSGCHDRL